MKLNRLFFTFSFLLTLAVQAQPPKTSPHYLFPIRPGEQNFLSGTMGELRSSHFHGGLDIKTGGQIGLPVYATSDGYISRINTSSSGYGHALYLAHDDGNTSVYAHLDKFTDELEAYVLDRQYESESYEVRLFPQKNEFRFKQGDLIAYSGNTGSSSGPHLHFEIRDPNQRFLNPLSYGFTEIKDNLPPLIKKVAFVTMDKDARINGAFGRFEFEVLKVKGRYTLRKPLELSGKIGMEIYHYDHLNGTYHRNGIPEITYVVDQDTLFRQNKNSMSFGLNRHILSHMNYSTYATSRIKFNKLYVDDGNEQDIYLSEGGIYDFNKRTSYELNVYLKDSYDNITTLNYTINQRKIVYPEVPKIKSFEVLGNTLQYVANDSSSTVYYAYKSEKNQPYFSRSGKYYYLWDLDQGLPDSIKSGESTIQPNFYMTVPSDVSFSFYNTDFELESYPKSLFDTLHVRFHKSYDSLNKLEEFSFMNGLDPLQANLKIRLKTQLKYGDGAAVYTKYGSRISYVGGEQIAVGTFEFTTRALTNFTIAYDSISPTITPITWRKPDIKFKIDDNLSGIKSYRATLNGEFLLMIYDSKRDLLTARPKKSNNSMSGEFKLEVEDNQGNKSELKRTL